MMRLAPAEPVSAPIDPTCARALKAQELRRAGMTDRAIAGQMTAELPHGVRRIISADEVARMILRLERQEA